MTTRKYELLHSKMKEENKLDVIRDSLREFEDRLNNEKAPYEDVEVTFAKPDAPTFVSHSLGVVTRKFRVVENDAPALFYNSSKAPSAAGLWIASTVAPIRVVVRVYRS